ncbi:hypothetical protein [Undibacterium sp.]|uniref:hypothetical protein n=1 Tax=Undibacterium sp. TaxID=1914977 RepID=UPI002731A722|nr:hypothetical protein [Undibacterium sp.]MDP1979154.1 hypothetical protein [Undibacterium sp.]
MSDVADMSDKNVETFIASAIAHVRRQQGMKATGQCRFCEEIITPRTLFCDSDCRDDYEKLKAAVARHGRHSCS